MLGTTTQRVLPAIASTDVDRVAEAGDVVGVVVGAEGEDDHRRQAAAAADDRDALGRRSARSRPTGSPSTRAARRAGRAACPRRASRRSRTRRARGSTSFVAADRAAVGEAGELVLAGAVDVEAGARELARACGCGGRGSACGRPPCESRAGTGPATCRRRETRRPDGRPRSRSGRRACRPSRRTGRRWKCLFAAAGAGIARDAAASARVAIAPAGPALHRGKATRWPAGRRRKSSSLSSQRPSPIAIRIPARAQTSPSIWVSSAIETPTPSTGKTDGIAEVVVVDRVAAQDEDRDVDDGEHDHEQGDRRVGELREVAGDDQHGGDRGREQDRDPGRAPGARRRSRAAPGPRPPSPSRRAAARP